jgi:PAS domain S-box-containing protein
MVEKGRLMKRILLVENSPTQACAFAMMLENDGLHVASATSGAEALERLQQEPFDLLLTSLTLPDQSGIDLCRSVKLANEFDPILMIVLTGSVELINILKSLEAGVDGYIANNREPDLIVAQVQQILDRGLPNESSELTDITFGGQKYTLAGSNEQILNIMLSAIDVVLSLNAQQTDLNQQLELELKHLRQTENELRESEKLYHSLVEKVPVAMFRKDLDGCFTFANQLFCHDLGCTPANVIGKTDFDFFPDELAEKYRRNDQAVIEQDRLFDDVEQHHTPDGRRIFVHVMKFPVRDDDGHISGVQAVFWDVTNQTLADEEFPDENPPDLD